MGFTAYTTPRTENQDPVVQSIVSLKRSVVKDLSSLTVLTKSIVAILLLKNCEKLLHCKNYCHFLATSGSVFMYILPLKI